MRYSCKFSPDPVPIQLHLKMRMGWPIPIPSKADSDAIRKRQFRQLIFYPLGCCRCSPCAFEFLPQPKIIHGQIDPIVFSLNLHQREPKQNPNKQACTQPERDQTKPKPNHAAIRNFLSTCDHRTSDHKSNDAKNQVCGPMSKGVHLSLCLRCCTSATQPWKLRLAKRNKFFLVFVEHLVVWGETCQPCTSIAHSVGP